MTDDRLAVRLSDLARSLQQEADVRETLNGVVAAAVQTVPGADHAGITVVRGRRVVTPAATDEVVRLVDRAQHEAGEGPCLDALRRRQSVRLPDMAAENRWPVFSRLAMDMGVRSMLSFQLYVAGDGLGALTLYARKAESFDDESEHVGSLFAAHAAIAMVGAQREQDLGQALTARDLIGQAKGILMERHKLTGDQAFHLLVRASQETNVRLVEVARSLVETGDLADR